MTGRLEGKVAIVTGAGTGIGRAIARRFAREGCAGLLVATSRNMDGLANVASEIGSRAAICRADVSVEADVHAMVHSALDNLGRLNVLVNNAVQPQASAAADRLAEEDWDRTLDVSLKAPFSGRSMPFRPCWRRRVEAAWLTFRRSIASSMRLGCPRTARPKVGWMH